MRIRFLAFALVAATAAAGFANLAGAQTLGSGFTYQGLLADNGVPANGSYDFEFALFTAAAGGTAVQTITQGDVSIAGGLVNTVLDFGASTWNGQVKWVEVRVRPGTSTGAYTVLAPRQALTGAPYALGLPMPFQRDVHSGNAPAVQIQQLDTGTAIKGVLPGSSNPAIYGVAPAGIGVQGDSNTGKGLVGISSSDTGVYGLGATGVSGESVVGAGVLGISSGFDGVHGETTTAAFAGIAGIGNHYGVYGQAASPGVAVWAQGQLYATGYSDFGADVAVHGNLTVFGDKNFAEPHPTDASREIVYTALEGGEAGTYFRGTAQLVNGQAWIGIPDDFAIVADAEGLTVQLTPVGQAASLYCVTRSLDGIEIAGAPDVVFDYQVNGVRKAFAGNPPIRENTDFVPDSPDASSFVDALPAESLRRMIANGTLNADGSVNMQTAHRLGWDKRPRWTDEPKRRPEPVRANAE